MRITYLRFSEKLVKNLLLSSKSTVNPLDSVVKRYAGHSKWQNIKHTKELNDKVKSINFLKIRQKIVSAVKEGSEDPKLNNKLKQALEEAKKMNMPVARVQDIIKKAVQCSTSKPFWLFYTGPSGVVVGFEVTSGNPNSAMSKINPTTKKLNLKHEKNYENLCSEKGVIISEPLKNVENAYEKALEDAIEGGIDEVSEIDDNTLMFECQPRYVEGASKKLQNLGYNIQSASTEVEFTNTVEMSDEEIKVFNLLLDKLQNSCEDLVRYVDNIELRK